MKSSLDTIEYLARSEHRVEVLDAIRTEPRTRADLRASVDASRVTVGRIVRDLEERGWIRRDGTRYETTPRGAYVAREFAGLVRNLEAYEALPPVCEWFPGDEPSFDLSLLDDATVVTADEGDLIAPIRRALAFVHRSERLRVVATGSSHEFSRAMREAIEWGATHTLVVPPAAVEALRADPEMCTDTHAMLDAGGLTLLRYDGNDDLPVMQIGDDAVLLCSGDHRAMLETDDPAVYEWAGSYFGSLRAGSTPVDAEAFGEVEETATGRTEDAAFVE